ncbi:GIN domain-containing protein [Pedobacter nototheniae]|uniref:GIN domain-containing protein n=1 Tax=Pedobacter nototheniae TaxID=2488994 RepID=UPI00292E10EC|nr:DUF2807 domain-containing protein [Pedobacter nototheniae]
MRTSIKIQLVSALLLAIAIIPANTFAKEKTPVTLSGNSSIRKIALKGNIEVILVQRSFDGVSYTDDNTGTAKVVRKGDVLQITGTSKEPGKLFVYVQEIYRIEAEDDVVVKTEDRLTTKFLQIFLKGNAQADINTNTQGLFTVMHDYASLKLSGSSNNHTLVMSKKQKLTSDNFVALNTDIIAPENLTVDNEIAAF